MSNDSQAASAPSRSAMSLAASLTDLARARHGTPFSRGSGSVRQSADFKEPALGVNLILVTPNEACQAEEVLVTLVPSGFGVS